MKNNLLKVKYLLPAAAVAIGILLLFIPVNNKADTTDEDAKNISFYTEELENKITALLLKVDGINDATVLITLENTGQQILAENTSTSSKEYVIINNGEADEGIKITDIYPEVRGVAVVCTNGNDAAVKEKITSLLASALGIPTNRITVVG